MKNVDLYAKVRNHPPRTAVGAISGYFRPLI